MDRRQAVSLFAFVLTGCGGGGGGGASPPPPPGPPTPSPFGVSSTSPADGSAGAARTTAVTATFSADVAAAGITPANVQLLGPQGNVIPSDLSSAGSSVQVVPRSALPGDTRYTLRFAGALEDSTGRTLGAQVVSRFTTASQTWAASCMEVGTLPYFTGQTHPEVLALPSGGVMVAWHTRVSGADTVFFSHYTAETGVWSAPATIHVSQQLGGSMGPLSLAAYPGGDVVVFWSEGTGALVQGARYAVASGTWSSLGGIQVVPAFASATSPTVVVDSHENITLVVSTGNYVYATRFDVASGVWSMPERIDHPATNGYVLSLRVAVDASDVVVAAWIQEVDPAGRAVYVARFDPVAGTWGAAQLAGTNVMQYMAMAVDAAGAITVAWATGASLLASPALWSSRWAPGQAQWSPQVRLDIESAMGVGAPAIAADPAGCVTVAWVQGGAPRAARFNPASNAGWSAPLLLGSQFIPGAPTLGLVADLVGNLTLTLTESQNQPMALRYSATSGQWQPGVPVGALSSGDPIFSNDPVAAVDGAGNVTLAWFAWNRLSGAEKYVVSVNRLQ